MHILLVIKYNDFDLNNEELIRIVHKFIKVYKILKLNKDKGRNLQIKGLSLIVSSVAALNTPSRSVHTRSKNKN